MMKKSNKKGFTLVELIVVIAIMAILAAVLVPTVTSKIRDANESAADSSCSALANSIQADVMSALAASDNTCAGQNCTVKVTPASGSTAAKVETTSVVDAYGEGKDIEISNDTTNGVIKIKHKNYDWYYTVNAEAKVTKANG